jgi:hypothetical protein
MTARQLLMPENKICSIKSFSTWIPAHSLRPASHHVRRFHAISQHFAALFCRRPVLPADDSPACHFLVKSIPHFGHLPGASFTTSGCIEQVYCLDCAPLCAGSAFLQPVTPKAALVSANAISAGIIHFVVFIIAFLSG